MYQKRINKTETNQRWVQSHRWVLRRHRSSWFPLYRSLWPRHPGQIPTDETHNMMQRHSLQFCAQCMLNWMVPLLITYLSPLNGFPQQSHHIFSFTVCCLEAFGPCHKDSLHTHTYNFHIKNRMCAFLCLLRALKKSILGLMFCQEKLTVFQWSISERKEQLCTHSVQAGLLAGEWEGEAQR